MASYKILKLRNEGIDLEKIENRVENMSALESSKKLRSGTLPRSLLTFQGEMCYVEYAQEAETEVTTLEGEDDDTVKIADMYPIIFLGNGFVAYDANYPNTDVEDNIQRTISDLVNRDVHPEPADFDEQDIKDVVEQANKVREANFKPTSQKPKSVSARYLPGLQETRFWQEYEKEPLERARVDLPDKSTYQVSFYEEGKITVHGHQISPKVQIDVLRYITDEVISNLDIDTFQKKLGGEYQ